VIELVRDLMTVGVPTCSPDTPVVDIAQYMLENDIEGVVVLNQEGHAVGVVTRDELVHAYTRDNCRGLHVEAIMGEDVPQIPPDIPLTAAAQIMQDQQRRVLFIMHHAEGARYPAALVSYRHILRHLAAEEDAKLDDLGVKAARESPLATFIKRRDAARRQASSKNESETGENHG
jgi:CBS domain-containing protein